MKSPIVLLTDYGLKDSYAGVLKGVFLKKGFKGTVLDLTHGIEPQNITQASYCLESAYRYFSKGAIFVCVVDPGVGTSRKILCAKSDSYYFFAPDNGLLSEVSLEEPFREIRSVENKRYFLNSFPSATFHGRDIFAPAAAALANNNKIFRNLGPEVKSFHSLPQAPLLIRPSQISGSVVYFDHFGNAITNIKQKMAPAHYWKRAEVLASGKSLGLIQSAYRTSKKLIALWNSSQRLEIACPMGRASDFLKMGSQIKVRV